VTQCSIKGSEAQAASVLIRLLRISVPRPTRALLRPREGLIAPPSLCRLKLLESGPSLALPGVLVQAGLASGADPSPVPDKLVAAE
jgi:hypothetical protein